MATTRFASEEEARAKMQEPATTIAAKRMILDARDFIYRERKSKNRDINAQAVIGTCKDMCPEQERLFRIENNCMNFYELDENGEPDEARMVKEYRRSGADQNEPLAHDLRNAAVMQRTMDYLCLEIVDKVDQVDNLGTWYEFIWDRTRCFRKDITLQMLCNNDSVSLIEKTARFHIFCSYYLCTEKPHNFDVKINTKHLADCIQSLKEQYHDLKTQQLFSPNEAEFMAYDILLNMDHFGAVHGLRNYRQDVRESIQVQLAFKLHAAFQCNDICVFFSLAKQCDFFQLCLLNSVINRFRTTGFNIIRRAFQDRSKNSVQFPKSYIVELFCFADDEELDRFCDYYEIEYNEDKISLPRAKEQNIGASQAMMLSRSDNLILPKCDRFFGRAILGNDGPTAVITHFPLYSSFENDRYRWSDFIEGPKQQNQPARSVIGISTLSHKAGPSSNPFGVQKMGVFNPFIMKPRENSANKNNQPANVTRPFSAINPFKNTENPFKSTENIRSSESKEPIKSFFGDTKKTPAHRLPSFSFLPSNDSPFKSANANIIDNGNTEIDEAEQDYDHDHDDDDGDDNIENDNDDIEDDDDYDEEEDERLIDEYAEAFTDMIFEMTIRDLLRGFIQEKLKHRRKEELIKSVTNDILTRTVHDMIAPFVELTIYQRHQRLTEVIFILFQRLLKDCLHETLAPVVEKPIADELEQRRSQRIRYLSSKYIYLWRFRIHERTSRKAFFPSVPGVFPALFAPV